MRDQGEVSPEVVRRVTRDLDLEESRLEDSKAPQPATKRILEAFV
jgi:hypothetical protein